MAFFNKLLGVVLRTQVEMALGWLAAFGRVGVLMVALFLVAWFVFKWCERRRFYRLLERSRISAPELKELLDRGEELVIVDLRSHLSCQADGLKLPGAIHIPPREFEVRYRVIPPGRPVVMYCT